MNTKHYLIISGIVGGVIGSLFTALLVSPVTAQRDKFGEIECRSLRVVDKHGQARVLLTTELFDMANDFSSGELRVMILGTSIGAYVVTYGKNGEASVTLSSSVYDYGGYVSVFDKNGYPQVNLKVDKNGEGVVTVGEEGKPEVIISSSGHGGLVSVYGKDGKGTASLSIAEHGGYVAAMGKDWKSLASLGIDERGGAVSVFGKDGISCKDGKRSISSAILGIGEHGGQVEVFGKGEGKAGMGINEYGNGVVASWDKNGYRRNNAKLKHWEEF